MSLYENQKKMKTKLILNNINKFNEISKNQNIEKNQRIFINTHIDNNDKDSNNERKSKNNILNLENKEEKDTYKEELNKENKEKTQNNYSPDDINKNININEVINQTENEKLKSSNFVYHETNSSCINNCFIWTLKAHVNKKNTTVKDFKSNYSFQGKNIFFEKLDFSVLNALNNPLCFDRCFPKNKVNFDNKKKILEKLKQESSRQLKEIDINKNESNNDNKNGDNASLKNILENNYPIDNSKNNFNIIDNNLCLKENLNNVFLLKFDLKNDVVNNNDFRLINDNCVERDIDFILNGEFHGNKIFKNDLTFSVTYRDFIKTIQFRLENFKNKIFDYSYNKRYNENNNKNHNYIIQERNQKIFYGKLINNVNIGIEFLKPQSFDKLQTNFNSIVNSEIELSKIFFELTIPKKLIKKNTLNLITTKEVNNKVEIKKEEILVASKKEEEKNKNVNIKEPKLYIPPPPSFIPQPLYIPPAPLYIPPPPPPPASWANLNFFNMRLDNKGIPLPPPFPNFNNLLYKKDYTSDNSSIRNQLVYNNKLPNVTFDYLSINNTEQRSPSLSVDPRNIYSSPCSGNYSPMSASYLMIQPVSYYGGLMRQQSMSMNSTFNISNYSSPYVKNNSNFPHLNLNTRKYSDNFNQELFDNLMDNNKFYNSNLQTPNAPKKNIDPTISFFNLQESLSQQSVENQNSLNDTDISSNGNQYSKNKKIQPMTIMQRIESFRNKNKDLKDKRIKEGNETGKKKKNIMRELRDSYVMANQGKTNLEIFLESVTPLYKNNIDFPFLKIRLIDIFNKFKNFSLFGLNNVYCFNGELINLSYILSLSSLSIKIINKSLMDEIIQELKKNYESLNGYYQLKDGEEIAINILQYTIYFSPEYIHICFSENKPYQFRKSFIKIITDFSKVFPCFNKITIEDINLIDSLFSILFSPLKCSKPYINYTSFVVYYQFTKEIIQDDKINKDYLNYDKQTIAGVLPIKINTNLYFQRIIIYNFVMNLSPLFNYFSPYFNNDTIMIKNMIYSVINDISKHMRGVSYDYESFMKLSKHNSLEIWK